MSRLGTLLLCLALVCLSQALYDKYSSVQSLTASDFSKVKKGVWLVEFFAPWCGHCRNLAPEYEKAAKALKGIANIAAIDADKERTDVQVQGFPTIKLFVDGKMSDYDGARTADGIVDFMFRKLRNLANERLGGGSSGSGRSDYSSGSGGFDEKDVIVLTDANFEENVYGDEAPWFVEFYAPWCGHCKNLAPEWAEMATSLKGQVKVAKVDATENKEIAARFGVQGYPTIKFFPGGAKDDGSAMDYSGPRSAAGMTEWALDQTKDLKHFEHTQLVSQQVYDDSCKGRSTRSFTQASVFSSSSPTSLTPQKKNDRPISTISRKSDSSSEPNLISLSGHRPETTSTLNRRLVLWELGTPLSQSSTKPRSTMVS